MNSPLGLTIGPYYVHSLLALGRLANIYLATDESLGRPAALKISHTPEYSGQIFCEGRLLAQVNHPAVATVYGIICWEQRGVMAMEFLDGGTLETRLDSDRLSLAEVQQIVEELLTGLDTLSRKQIVHGDIKPANIGFTTAGQFKLFDLGISRYLEDPQADAECSLHFSGTPACVSPEQLCGLPVTVRSDIFSFGVMHYRMLTGTEPFTGETLPALLFKILHHNPPAPSMLDPRIPVHVSAAVMRALAKDPARRFEDGGQYLESLRLTEPEFPPDSAFYAVSEALANT